MGKTLEELGITKTFHELRNNLLEKKALGIDAFYGCPKCTEEGNFAILNFDNKEGASCVVHGVVFPNCNVTGAEPAGGASGGRRS